MSTAFDNLKLGGWYKYEAVRYGKDFVRGVLKHIGPPDVIKEEVVPFMNIGIAKMEVIADGREAKGDDEGTEPSFKITIEFSPLQEDWLEQFWASIPESKDEWNWQREFVFRPETVML
jgi:hypothetical protein